MSYLSNLARTRNFLKRRISGSTGLLGNLASSQSGLTTEEKQQLLKAKKILESILYKPLWDMNTRELGLTPLKDKNDKGAD
jgi:hypothetical protein